MDNYIRKSDAVYCACKVLDKFGGCKQGVFCPDFGCKEVREEFDKLPAADVVERKTGEWEKQQKDFDLCGVEYFACSLCGFECQLTYSFCPNCGADMR